MTFDSESQTSTTTAARQPEERAVGAAESVAAEAMADSPSAEEVRTFLRSLSQAETTSPGLQRQDRRIKSYNFRSPDKFSRDQLRALQTVHEAVARALTTSYSAALGVPVQVSLLPLMQIPYSQFLALVGASVLYIFTMAPLPGMAIMEFTTPLGFRMVERLLGGRGDVPVEVRPPTEIEIAVLNRLAGRTLEMWKQEWAQVVEIEPHIEGMETDPQFVQIVSVAETTLVVPFEVVVEDFTGGFNLCIPSTNIESVVGRFAVRHWFRGQTQTATPATRTGIGELLKQSALPVVACLGSARITLRELLQLAEGDVLRLKTPAKGEVVLQVKDRAKFRGQPGLVGARLAIKVTAVCEGDDNERVR